MFSLWQLSMFMFNYALKCLYLIVTFVFGSQDNSGSTWAWLEPTLSYLFSAFWVLPLIFLSRIVTAFWFQDIADTSFKGRPQPFRSISQLIADLLFSLLIQMLFLMQANLFYLFPIAYIGEGISLLHVSLLYSLYSFEYKWFNMGTFTTFPLPLTYLPCFYFQVGNCTKDFWSSSETGHIMQALGCLSH